MFHKFEQKINDLSSGTIGSFCVRCHQQAGTQLGEPREAPIWERSQIAREGVTCVTCHRVDEEFAKVNGERRIIEGSIHAPVYGSLEGSVFDEVLARAGSLQLATSPGEKGRPIHAAVVKSEQISKSEFCVSCHQVAVNLGIKLEVVWDQYRDSPAHAQGTTCQECHMGKVPGRAEGYETAPSAMVGGRPINPGRRHSNHAFYGPGYTASHPGLFPHNPRAARWSPDVWLEFDYRSEWGTDKFEDRVYDVNRALGDFRKALAELKKNLVSARASKNVEEAVAVLFGNDLTGTAGQALTSPSAASDSLLPSQPVGSDDLLARTPSNSGEGTSQAVSNDLLPSSTNDVLAPQKGDNSLVSGAIGTAARVSVKDIFKQAQQAHAKLALTLQEGELAAKQRDALLASTRRLDQWAKIFSSLHAGLLNLGSNSSSGAAGKNSPQMGIASTIDPLIAEVEQIEKSIDILEIAFEVDFPASWKVADDRVDARKIIDENLSATEDKKRLRQAVMENGSHIDGPFLDGTPKIGEDLSFSFKLTNTNQGHNLPSGSLGAQPELWLNVALIDPSGKNLWESGYVDANGDMADIHSLEVAAGRIEHDDQLFNLQTKFLTTNVKGTEREMYLPINLDVDQLPFIRPANVPATVLNHPPFVRMEGRSLPPGGSRVIDYSVPAKLISQPGRYRIAVRMRSRAEPIYFMRFVEATREMERAMNEWMIDIHAYTVELEVVR